MQRRRRAAPPVHVQDGFNYGPRLDGASSVEIDHDLFDSNPYYRCVVLQRLAHAAHHDVDWMTTRDLLRKLWSEGGSSSDAALRELRFRFYGTRRVVA